jgi:hypothetical protein
MAEIISRNKKFLRTLSKAKCPKTRKRLLSHATPQQIRALQEIAYNARSREFPLKQTDIKKIIKGRYRAPIYEAGKKGSLKSKRELFIQHGGFLQYLIPVALGALANLV